MYYSSPGGDNFFIRGPHEAFIWVSWANFMTKVMNQSKKKSPWAGRMWPAGLVLPPRPPDLADLWFFEQNLIVIFSQGFFSRPENWFAYNTATRVSLLLTSIFRGWLMSSPWHGLGKVSISLYFLCFWRPGANFINILQAIFLYKSLLSSFSVLTS